MTGCGHVGAPNLLSLPLSLSGELREAKSNHVLEERWFLPDKPPRGWSQRAGAVTASVEFDIDAIGCSLNVDR